eukprot:m.44551 g.44551  ORF g.44551 m.44551 type:complete len:972 (-) comp12336_c0_seq1:385-3300(-)
MPLSHAWTYMRNKHKPDGELRNTELELRGFKTAQKTMIKQSERLSKELQKWSDASEDETLQRFVRTVVDLETKDQDSARDYLSKFREFAEIFHSVIVDREEIHELKNKMKDCARDVVILRGRSERRSRRLASGVTRGEAEQKAKAQLRETEAQVQDAEDTYRMLTDKFNKKMFSYQKSLHERLRSSFYELSCARMRALKFRADLEEQLQHALAELPTVSEFNGATFSFKPFEEPVGNTDPIWHHGEQFAKLLEFERATANSKLDMEGQLHQGVLGYLRMEANAKEAALREEISKTKAYAIQLEQQLQATKSSGVLSALLQSQIGVLDVSAADDDENFVSYILGHAQMTDRAVEDLSTALQSEIKDDADFVAKASAFSMSLNATLLSAIGYAKFSRAENSTYLLTHVKTVSSSAGDLIGLAVARASEIGQFFMTTPDFTVKPKLPVPPASFAANLDSAVGSRSSSIATDLVGASTSPSSPTPQSPGDGPSISRVATRQGSGTPGRKAPPPPSNSKRGSKSSKRNSTSSLSSLTGEEKRKDDDELERQLFLNNESSVSLTEHEEEPHTPRHSSVSKPAFPPSQSPGSAGKAGFLSLTKSGKKEKPPKPGKSPKVKQAWAEDEQSHVTPEFINPLASARNKSVQKAASEEERREKERELLERLKQVATLEPPVPPPGESGTPASPPPPPAPVRPVITESKEITAAASLLRERLGQMVEYVQMLSVRDQELRGLANNTENELERNLDTATQMLEDSMRRLDTMMKECNSTQSGRLLETNTALITFSRETMLRLTLVLKGASQMKKDLYKSERGTELTMNEFAHKHGKWATGFESIVTQVAETAPLLMESLNEVVRGRGKHEEMQVAVRAISAHTAQLIASSRNKMLRDGAMSKETILNQGGYLITSSQQLLTAIRDSYNLSLANILIDDYKSLNANQAKRMMMAKQVEVLKLEAELEREREKLGQLKAIVNNERS